MKTVRKPRWYFIPIRVLLVTFVITLLSFAICLLLGISGIAVVALLKGVHPDMRLAYREVAAPGAVIIAACVFTTMLVIEIKRFRQSRTLDGIARASR
jgi:hypothetical protein